MLKKTSALGYFSSLPMNVSLVSMITVSILFSLGNFMYGSVAGLCSRRQGDGNRRHFCNSVIAEFFEVLQNYMLKYQEISGVPLTFLNSKELRATGTAEGFVPDW